MNVKIYEERTGLLIFPEKVSKEPEKEPKELEKDENAIRFFNNSIDLYIEKKESELRIYCYVVARKGLERYKGYYIKSISKFAEDSFTEFKKESTKALRTLELQYNPDDTDNIMFDNIEKFDSDIYCYEDIDVIKSTLETGEYLEYRAGNIDEISIFCKEILKKIDSAKIAISSEESKLGDINILRSQKREEPLTSSERTKQLLNRRREELIEKKRKEEEERGKSRIREGSNIIREGIGILISAGCDPKEISAELDNVYKDISALKRNSKDIKKIEKASKLPGLGSSPGSGSDSKSKILRGISIILIIISVLLISSSIWHFPFNLDSSIQISGQSNTPVPTATSNPSSPTVTVSPTVPIVTTNPTEPVVTLPAIGSYNNGGSNNGSNQSNST